MAHGLQRSLSPGESCGGPWDWSSCDLSARHPEEICVQNLSCQHCIRSIDLSGEKCRRWDWRFASRFLRTSNRYKRPCYPRQGETAPFVAVPPNQQIDPIDLTGKHRDTSTANESPESDSSCRNGHSSARLQSCVQYRLFVFYGMSRRPSGTPIACHAPLHGLARSWLRPPRPARSPSLRRQGCLGNQDEG